MSRFENGEFLVWAVTSDYSEFLCFLWLWDIRPKGNHWVQREWTKRRVLRVGQLNVTNQPLVDRQKTVFPPLHTKLRQFVIAINKKMISICVIFSRSFLKASIFNGLQIRKLKNDKTFAELMSLFNRTAWGMFIAVIDDFLSKEKSVNYNEQVANMLKTFQKLGCNMRILRSIFYWFTWTDFLITWVTQVTNTVNDFTKI